MSLSEFPGPRHVQTGPKDEVKTIREVISLQRFGRLVMDAEDLLHRYYKPRYKRYKYVSSMPASIYKSLQILITQKLLRSEYYQNLYKEYLRNLQMSKLKPGQPN